MTQTVVPIHDLVGLAKRIATAPAEQEEMMIHGAWVTLHPQETLRCVGRDETGLLYGASSRYLEYRRFALEGQFLAAACMLLPEGWKFADIQGEPDDPVETVAVDPEGIPKHWASGETEALRVASLACLAHADLRTHAT